MTRSERLISAVLLIAFASLILLAILDQYSPKKLSILFFLLFWLPMLVLHEIGHAIVARAVGWDVREIVIGFGRELARFDIGGTRVRLKIAPVEGYVVPSPKTPELLRLKSALIYAAGPGAELLLLGLLIALLGWEGVFNDSDAVASVAVKSLAVVILYGALFNLLPFRVSGGGVSDGLGVISSPFMPQEVIELRLAATDIQDVEEFLIAENPAAAAAIMDDVMKRYPDNDFLQRLYVKVLAKRGVTDEARRRVANKLAERGLSETARYAWLMSQASVEWDAEVPNTLVLDLALQEALKLSPNAPDALALRGASFVRRGQWESGGDMLANAWRRNNGEAEDAFILAYLTVAAHQARDQASRQHFFAAFAALSPPAELRQVVATTGLPAKSQEL